MSSMRAASASVSTWAVACSRPIPVERRTKAIAPPVAIIVFEGMQSHRWAAPPTTSRSIIVTSAPQRWAYVAAVLPAGPPPMMTKRVVTASRLDGRNGPGSGPHRGGTVATMVDEAPDAAGALSGSGLAAERVRRQGQVDAIRAAGGEPYPYRFDRSDSVAAVRAQWPDLEPGAETSDEVSVAGRIVLKRDTGKLVFATIAERGAEIQLFMSQAVIGDDRFGALKDLDRGDWVGVHGTVMATRAGELSVKVDRLVLLAKSLRPLPDKWH